MLLKNILWDYAGRFSLLFVNLAITGVLSRILTPADYGAVGIVLAVIGLILSDGSAEANPVRGRQSGRVEPLPFRRRQTGLDIDSPRVA